MSNPILTMTAMAALVAGLGLAAGPVWADETGDDIQVNSTGDGDVNSRDGNNVDDVPVNPNRAADDNFVSFYSVGEGGQVVILFQDNTALAGGDSDPDIVIWDRCGAEGAGVTNADEPVDVDVSQGAAFTNDVVTNTTSDPLGAVLDTVAGDTNRFRCPVNVDLDSVFLAAATEVRITDLCDLDTSTEEAFSFGCDSETAGGIDIAEVEALNSLAFGTDNIMKSIDGDENITETGEDSGFDDQQFFTFVIEVNNPEGEDLTGFTFQDTVPAEFDITDAVATAGCTIVSFEEGGAKGKGQGNQKLAPDHVTFTVDLAATESCTVTVDVATDDDHPGGGNSPIWTPTSCPEGETLTLNDGVEVFDTETGDLIFQDDSSLELTCTLDPPA